MGCDRLTCASTQILIYGGFAWGAGGIQQWLRRNPAAQVAIGRGVGVLLMLAALWTAWHGTLFVHLVQANFTAWV
jgi:threonine/homoserine/homoserine lactone efflux protein